MFINRSCFIARYFVDEFPTKPTDRDGLNYPINIHYDERVEINNEFFLFLLNLHEQTNFEKRGNETFHYITYRAANICFICFNINQPKSLQDVIDKWMPEINLYIPDVMKILIGLKSDLRSTFLYCDHELLVFGYIHRHIRMGDDIINLILKFTNPEIPDVCKEAGDDSHRNITNKEIKEVLKQCEIDEYIEISSFNDANVHQVFETAIKIFIMKEWLGITTQSAQSNNKCCFL